MTLDIHLAKDQKEAQRISRSASLELQSHELIFNRLGFPESKYPLFRRMEDYYQDARYEHSDIQILINEVEEIRTLFKTNPQLYKQLSVILEVCRKAQEEKLSIWVFCD